MKCTQRSIDRQIDRQTHTLTLSKQPVRNWKENKHQQDIHASQTFTSRHHDFQMAWKIDFTPCPVCGIRHYSVSYSVCMRARVKRTQLVTYNQQPICTKSDILISCHLFSLLLSMTSVLFVRVCGRTPTASRPDVYPRCRRLMLVMADVQQSINQTLQTQQCISLCLFVQVERTRDWEGFPAWSYRTFIEHREHSLLFSLPLSTGLIEQVLAIAASGTLITT